MRTVRSGPSEPAADGHWPAVIALRGAFGAFRAFRACLRLPPDCKNKSQVYALSADADRFGGSWAAGRLARGASNRPKRLILFINAGRARPARPGALAQLGSLAPVFVRCWPIWLEAPGAALVLRPLWVPSPARFRLGARGHVSGWRARYAAEKSPGRLCKGGKGWYERRGPPKAYGHPFQAP